MRLITSFLASLFMAAIGALSPVLAATVRVEYVRANPAADGAAFMPIDQMVDATGLLVVTTGSPLTGASRLTVPTPASASALQLYARVTVIDGAVIVRTGADAASTGPGTYISLGDIQHFPVKAGDLISMIETTPVTQASGGGGSGGLTDTQLRASPVGVQGSRLNDGTDLASGKSHLTIGGSDGTNLRPIAIDMTGRSIVTGDNNAPVPVNWGPSLVTSFTSSATFTANQILTTIDMTNYRGLSIQVVGLSGGGTGYVFEWSNDGANWTIATLYSLTGTTATSFNAAGFYTTPKFGKLLRLRAISATSSGTTNIIFEQVQTTPQIWFATQGVSVSGVASVGLTYVGNATNAGLSYALSSPATPTVAQIKGSAGRLIGCNLLNTAASPRWGKAFNALSASVTLGTTAAVFEVPIPVGQSTFTYEGGIAFAGGLSLAITSAKGLTDSTSTGLAAGDVTGFCIYQ